MRDYSVRAVGLEVLSENEDQVLLGTDHPVLQLTVGEGEPFSTPTEAGLYHSAILYAYEASLAATIYRIATVAPQTYQGSADHAVSLAFYFVDPEGNGLELYVDTPEDTWRWVNGEVRMGSAALDPNAFIQEHLTEADAAAITDGPLATDAIMGHVHMKVGDLAEAEAFYADTLGFAVTARSDGALFYSVGGYHHHLATNAWQSQGAGERANDTGLGSLSVVVESEAAVQQVADRLDAAGHASELTESGLTTVDPWGNTVHLIVR